MPLSYPNTLSRRLLHSSALRTEVHPKAIQHQRRQLNVPGELWCLGLAEVIFRT